MDPQDLLAFLRGLRAVRRFADTPIPDAALHDVLDVARWTGSAKNTQPWEIVVVRDPASLAELATCGPFAGHLAGARTAVVLVMEDEGRRLDEGRLAQSVMLAAWAHGVGSCIASLFPEDNNARAKALLGVPAERWMRTAISLGYPADAQATRLSADRRGLPTVPIGRKPAVELVHWERYGQHTA